MQSLFPLSVLRATNFYVAVFLRNGTGITDSSVNFCCRSPCHTTSISTHISTDDVQKGFGKWKESTSTSPSGRHLGHYKAIIQHPILLECLTKFLSIAISRGLSISRWQNAINIMLEKDPGRPTINRLRIIHLFEADFNFFLKIMWGYRLVHRAKDYNMINTGQYGSVPGKTAIELVMLNQISNDICRTNKTNLIRFENDASACYDRILVHLGMMAARRCGMPPNAIKTHAETLESMKYKVKTAFGISEDSYSGELGKPLFWHRARQRRLSGSLANPCRDTHEHTRSNNTRTHNSSIARLLNATPTTHRRFRG